MNGSLNKPMNSEKYRIIDALSIPVFYVIGLCSVLYFRLGTELHVIWALVVPLLLIVLYGTIHFIRGMYGQSGERAVDNVYYLGFLFTVTTLGVALYRYQISVPESQDQDVRQIIGDLGVGLSTTIVGLLGRIVLGLISQEPTGNSVDDMKIAGHIRQEWIKSIESSRDMIVKLSETIKRINRQTAEMAEETQGLFEKTSEGISSSAKSLENRITEIRISEEIFVSALNPAFNRLAMSANTIAAQIESIKVNPNIIDESITKAFIPLQESIRDMGRVIKNIDSSIASLSARSKDIDDLAESTGRIMENLGKLGRWSKEISVNYERLAGINVSIKDTTDAVNRINPSIDQFRKEIAATHEKYKESVESMTDAMSAIREHSEEISRLIQGVGDDFADAMGKLVKSANLSISGGDTDG